MYSKKNMKKIEEVALVFALTVGFLMISFSSVYARDLSKVSSTEATSSSEIATVVTGYMEITIFSIFGILTLLTLVSLALSLRKMKNDERKLYR